MKRLWIMLLLTPLMSLATTTYYVNASSGADSNSGKSLSSAKKTIQAAIDVAVDGDTINVEAGVYSPITTGNKCLSIIGVQGPQQTIIDGKGTARCVLATAPVSTGTDASTNATLVGFTLCNGYLAEGWGAGMFGGVLRQCIVKDNRNPNGGGGGVGYGILYNCLLVGNYAINGGATEGCELYNCTVTENSVRDSGSAAWESVFFNCIVYNNNRSQWFYWDEAGIAARHHLVGSSCRINVCTEDPKFVDAANGDYRLAQGSPCIDLGDNSYVQGGGDLAGNRRIANGRVDIGAYEYGSTPVASSLQDGLVAWYKFDGNADDSSGCANHGTTHGTTWTADRNGNSNGACSFGGDDWISVPHADTLSVDALTVSVWFKQTAWCEYGNVGYAPILCKSDTRYAEGSYRYQIEIRNEASISYAGVDISDNFALNRWQMLTITHGGGSRKVYLNGVFIGGSTSGNPAKLADELCIGRNIVGATQYYNGLMDDLRIYNRALSAAEVKSLYEEGAETQSDGDLIHRWSFDGNLTDSVGGQTAKIVGNVTTDGKQYTLAGGSRGSSYIDLGSNILPKDGRGVTLEIWGTQRSVKNWSRIWDIGGGTSTDMQMAWTAESNINSDGICIRGTGEDLTSKLAPYTLDVEFHVATVFKPQDNGTWKVYYYKQDASTGATLTSAVIDSTGSSWSLTTQNQDDCWLGHSHWSGDYDANASYNEVRVWGRALTEAELTANALLGPDVLPGGPSSGVGKVLVTSVTAQQRYPWNGLVDIAVTIQGAAEDVAEADCLFVATNCATRAAIPVEHITRNGNDAGSGGVIFRKFIWDAKADVGAVKIDDVALTVDIEWSFVQLWEGGPFWSKYNVGATNPEETGYYFWWGDTVGYKRNANNDGWVSVANGAPFSFSSGNCPTYNKSISQLRSAGYIDATGNLVAAHDAATAHLGAPWRMPTEAEFSALINNCTSTWTMRNGVSGMLVTGKDAYSSKSIFFPAAGGGSGSRFSGEIGSHGLYYSSTSGSNLLSYGEYGVWYLIFHSGNFYLNAAASYFGNSVRPVRGFAKMIDVAGCGVTTHFVWDPLACTVTFNANGGYCVTSSEQYFSGAMFGALLLPTRSGYVFDGWYTAANGGTKVSEEDVVMGDITLFAHWLELKGAFICTQYDINASVSSLTVAKSCLADSSNWKSDPVARAYDVVAFSDDDTTSRGFETVAFPGNATKSDKKDNFVMVATGKVIIPDAGDWSFACGTDDGFELTLTGGGRSHTMSYESTRSYGNTVKTFNLAAGVYDLNLIYFESTGGADCLLSAAKGKYTSFNSSAFKLIGDAACDIVAAITSPDPIYTTVFNAAGGSPTLSVITREAGEMYESLPTVVRDTYVFNGWYTAMDGGEQVLASDKPSGDSVVYAHWLSQADLLAIGIDSNGFTWQTGGAKTYDEETVDWTLVSDAGCVGGGCVQSGVVDGNESVTWLQTTVSEPGTISFKYKFRAYLGAFTITCDGEELFRREGPTGSNVGWEAASVDITEEGSHQIRFSYQHGGVSYGSGHNGVMLDDFGFTPSHCHVILKANNGTDDSKEILVKLNEPSALPKVMFGQFNSTFQGWAMSETGAVKYSDGATVKFSDHTVVLYAQWRAYSYAEILDVSDCEFQSGGNGNWSLDTAVSKFGGHSVRSGSVGDRQSSWMRTGVTGPTVMTFWWKVSSEADYDFLKVLVDGDEEKSISGETDWQKVSLVIQAGAHTVEWQYAKDQATVAGSDCGWVDRVEFSTAYVVTFDGNGGTAPVEGKAYAPGESYGELPACARSGSRFLGWFTQADGGTEVKPADVVSSDVTLYAHWEELSYGLLMRYYDGVGNAYTQWTQSFDSLLSYFYARTPTLTEWSETNTDTLDFGVTSSGCKYHGKYAISSTDNFAMWMTGYVDLKFCGEYEFNVKSDDGFVLYVDGRLVAKYTSDRGMNGSGTSGKIALTRGVHRIDLVHRDASGDHGLCLTLREPFGDGLVNIQQTDCPKGAAIRFEAGEGAMDGFERRYVEGLPILDLPSPVREGYDFIGWFTREEGGVRVKASDVFEGQSVLYARWEATVLPNATKVEFDANGGMSEETEHYYTARQEYGWLPSCTRVGYDFIGWYTAKGGGKLIAAGSIVAGEATLYAHWRRQIFDLTFDAVGGCAVGSVSVPYGECIGNLPIPTKEGCVFDGWYDTAVGGNRLGPDAVITAEQKLYAHWTNTDEVWLSDKKLDIYSGARRTSEAQQLTMSPEWEEDGAKAIVSVDGVPYQEATSAGECTWAGTRTKEYTLTHQVVDASGAAVGEPYVVQFIWLAGDLPAIRGDENAVVTGDAEHGFVITPNVNSVKNVEVIVPQGMDAGDVLVKVPAGATTVKPNGAKMKVVNGGADITEFLNVPAAGEDGVIDLSKVTVKEEIVKETMDVEKGAEIELNAANPKLTTAPTREGLFYQLREGETLDGMKDGDSTIGNGQPWTPKITVKDGDSAFYSIGVGKGN